MAKLKNNQFLLPSGHLVTERPILYQTDMVQAILEDRKTQTRRTKGLDHVDKGQFERMGFIDANQDHYAAGIRTSSFLRLIKSPYGKPGDLLWVRETWLKYKFNHLIGGKEYCYKSDVGSESDEIRKEYIKSGTDYRWKPSIHMPKDACRIWLMVEHVRVERLQEISEEDAISEGIQMNICVDSEFDVPVKGWKDYQSDDWFTTGDGYKSPEERSFRSLWKSINGEDSWNSNPWVWVIKFRVLSKIGKPSMGEIERNYLELTGKEVTNG